MSAFKDDARELGTPSGGAYDVSSGRLARLRARVANVPIAEELLEIEARVAAQPAFDPQLESVGHCYTDNGEGKPFVALHPGFPDDKLASFYVHEMAHLRQMLLADDVYAANPMSMCELLLISTFVKEADAYMRQHLFACCAFVQGDHGILEDLRRKPPAELLKEDIQANVVDKLSSFPAEGFLNTQFWDTMRKLTSSPGLASGYFGDVVATLRTVGERFGGMTFEQLGDVDNLPPLSGSDLFQRLRPMAAFNPADGGGEVNYFQREDASRFFDKFFLMLPEPLQRQFHEEKTVFMAAFYTALGEAGPHPPRPGKPKPPSARA